MDPIQCIQSSLDDLTKAEQRAARFILDNPTTLIGHTISGIAQACGASNAAIIRMCQKLGYNGFSEFRFSVRNYLMAHGSDLPPEESPASPEPQPVPPPDNSSQGILDTYIRYIKKIPGFVSSYQLQAMARDIIRARHFDIWGVNRSAQAARHLSSRLGRLGIYNKLVEDWVVMRDDADIFTSEDLCIIFTKNGVGNGTYAQELDTLRERNCPVWLVTMNPKLDLIGKATHAVVLPWVSRDNATNFYEDQIVAYLFDELLLHEVAKLCQN